MSRSFLMFLLAFIPRLWYNTKGEKKRRSDLCRDQTAETVKTDALGSTGVHSHYNNTLVNFSCQVLSGVNKDIKFTKRGI